jgi:hypothetical protein
VQGLTRHTISASVGVRAHDVEVAQQLGLRTSYPTGILPAWGRVGPGLGGARHVGRHDCRRGIFCHRGIVAVGPPQARRPRGGQRTARAVA